MVSTLSDTRKKLTIMLESKLKEFIVGALDLLDNIIDEDLYYETFNEFQKRCTSFRKGFIEILKEDPKNLEDINHIRIIAEKIKREFDSN